MAKPKRNRILLIDDVRDLNGATVIARNFWEGIKQLEINGPWDELWLDHDLASYDGNRERTGYDIMLFLEQFPMHKPEKIVFVTSNPVGRQRMEIVRKKLYS